MPWILFNLSSFCFRAGNMANLAISNQTEVMCLVDYDIIEKYIL